MLSFFRAKLIAIFGEIICILNFYIAIIERWNSLRRIAESSLNCCKLLVIGIVRKWNSRAKLMAAVS